MDEEMTMRNAIINRKTGNMTISKLNMDMLREDEDDYQLIVVKKGDKPNGIETGVHIKNGLNKLPELLHINNGYGLVTEVYVNNGYNYSSSPSSPGSSNSSSLERKPKVRQVPARPGCLLIEVEDCPDNYIRVDDSDSFEPDTLDRKPAKMTAKSSFSNCFENSKQILLRTTGSFKNTSSLDGIVNDQPEGLNRNFGSLREIYEAKTKRSINLMQTDSIVWKNDWDSEEGRLLTLEERHCRRQRRTTKDVAVPPDVIPPPPHDVSPIYEHPKPPRKVVVEKNGVDGVVEKKKGGEEGVCEVRCDADEGKRSKNEMGRSTPRFGSEVSFFFVRLTFLF